MIIIQKLLRSVTMTLVGIALSTTAVGAVDLTYASGLPDDHPINAGGILPLIKNMSGDMNITFTGGGQLFGLSDALQSVGSGISDFTIVQPSYHPSELPHVVMLFNLLLLTRNELAAAGASAETILKDCPECMDDYARAGAISLANIAIGGYSLMCRYPIDRITQIQGRRVRATGSLGRWIEHLGGVPVSMTSSDMVESFQRGLLDCIMGFTAWYKAFAIGDSVKGIYNYDIGATGAVSIVTANRRSWDALTGDQKRKLWDAMPFAISSAMINGNGYIGQDIVARRDALSAGVKITDGSTEITPLWEAYKNSELDAVIASARTLGVKKPDVIAKAYMSNYEKWLKLVDDAGLSNIHAGGELLTDEQLRVAQQKFEKLLHSEIYDRIDPTKL